jgi:hypothetical protein
MEIAKAVEKSVSAGFKYRFKVVDRLSWQRLSGGILLLITLSIPKGSNLPDLH